MRRGLFRLDFGVSSLPSSSINSIDRIVISPLKEERRLFYLYTRLSRSIHFGTRILLVFLLYSIIKRNYPYLLKAPLQEFNPFNSGICLLPPLHIDPLIFIAIISTSSSHELGGVFVQNKVNQQVPYFYHHPYPQFLLKDS